VTLAYWEWSADDDADPDDWTAVAAANPGTAVGRITQEFTLIERAAMTDEEFRRERMGIVELDLGAALRWQVIDAAAWAVTESDADPWIEAPRFAVEVEPGDAGACIAVAGVLPDGHGIELVDRRDGTKWLTARLAELVERHAPGRAVLVDAGSEADTFAGLHFGPASIDVERLKTADVVQASADLARGVADGSVFHRSDHDQALLTEAAAAATKRTYGDVWLWDRRTGAVVLPILAASLALWGSRQSIAEPEPDFIVV